MEDSMIPKWAKVVFWGTLTVGVLFLVLVICARVTVTIF
jgi:hypothetical protein